MPLLGSNGGLSLPLTFKQALVAANGSIAHLDNHGRYCMIIWLHFNLSATVKTSAAADTRCIAAITNPIIVLKHHDSFLKRDLNVVHVLFYFVEKKWPALWQSDIFSTNLQDVAVE